MELKYTNFNGEIVLESKLIDVELLFLLRNESYKLFFQENALIARK